MGKDLKGKELGLGICQRKDGLYTARYVNKNGKRVQKYFRKIRECRNWIADSRFEDEHGYIGASSGMTVDAWFEYWIKEMKEPVIRWTTLNNYKDRYRKNVRDVIGKMMISDVKPMHCQNVLNVMYRDGYKHSSIDKTRSVMASVFSDACENNIIQRNPVTRSVKCPRKELWEDNSSKVLTIEEQKKFMEESRKSVYYDHFLFVLHTGVRMSELRGLKWQDIDFKNRIIHINRNLVFNSKNNTFIVGDVKTNSAKREIPMTQAVYDILLRIRKESSKKKIIPLEFIDYVFLNKNGMPNANNNYSCGLAAVCQRAGIKKISLHGLRHTFATRCIESGMKPSTLQRILGHANIATTMNLYVHTTDEEKEKEMRVFEKMYSIV